MPKKIWQKLVSREPRFLFARPLLILLGLIVCTAFIVDATYNPFLYFRF